MSGATRHKAVALRVPFFRHLLTYSRAHLLYCRHRRQSATPNMNAYAERWVQSVQTECLDHFVVLGERHLEHILREYLAYYHLERPHQAKGNRPLSGHDSSNETGPPGETEPSDSTAPRVGRVVCHERLGGLLKHYTRQAA